MSKEKPTPHFHEATTGETLTYLDENGQVVETAFSLWQPPSTSEHAAQQLTPLGRTSYRDIDKIRQQNSSELARIDAEYGSLDKPEILATPTGEKVAIRVVNKEAEGDAICLLGSFSTDSRWQNNRGIVEALALTFPGQKIMFIDTPSAGGSDPLTDERYKELKSTGSYIPMAEQLQAALTTTDYKIETVVGLSEGGRIAIALGGLCGAKDVIAFDPPGHRTQPRFSLAKGFGGAGSVQKEIKKVGPDGLMKDAHKKDQSIGLKHMARVKKHQIWGRLTAMAKGALSADIAKTIKNGTKIVDVRSGRSEMSITDDSVKLAKILPGYKSFVLPGAGHATPMELTPFGIAALVEQVKDIERSTEHDEAFTSIAAAMARTMIKDAR